MVDGYEFSMWLDKTISIMNFHVLVKVFLPILNLICPLLKAPTAFLLVNKNMLCNALHWFSSMNKPHSPVSLDGSCFHEKDVKLLSSAKSLIFIMILCPAGGAPC